MKPQFGDLVRVTWDDIRGDSGWANLKEEDLTPAVCTNYGIFNCVKKGNLYLFASFHDSDIGDRICIPKSVVKEIKVIRKNVYRKATGSK